MTPDDYFEHTELFAKAEGVAPMTPDRFATDMEFFVNRVRLLHWTVDKLAMSEFSTHEDNEWIWRLSSIAFEVILRDAKKAAELARDDDIRARKSASIETLEAMKAVQRDELRASGLDAQKIEDRVKASEKLVRAEMERWANRTKPNREIV